MGTIVVLLIVIALVAFALHAIKKGSHHCSGCRECGGSCCSCGTAAKQSADKIKECCRK